MKSIQKLPTGPKTMNEKIFRAIQTGKYKMLREVTKWDVTYRPPNHDYVINDKGQMVGYRPYGTGEWQFLDKPSKKFSTARRQFRELHV